MFNKSFYPTPKNLIVKMVSRISGNDINRILEPSAGKGDIIEHIADCSYSHRIARSDIDAIEIDPTLRATLWGKDINVVDSDFLSFQGADKYDVIITNPPFDSGDKHLLKAIEIMYSGEIIFLLNAETIKNPCTNTRKVLAQKLQELHADVEFIPNAFLQAERKTGVEVALVYIKIEKQVEEDLFGGMTHSKIDADEKIQPDSEIASLDSIKNMVDDYNRIIEIGSRTIVDFYKNFNHVGKYIHLSNQGQDHINTEHLTSIMQNRLNVFLREVRSDFWNKVLALKDVWKRLTSKELAILRSQITKQSYMDFTESNIRTFIINLIDNFESILAGAVVRIFELMTKSHSWHERNVNEKNIHYYNGWKTNKAFYVNKKVILPYSYWDDTFDKWNVNNWRQGNIEVNDIDIVMNYFDGASAYRTINKALEVAFVYGETSKVESTYFIITVYKKGTLHLTFRDENIRRRFNVTACKGKNWLPQDYGNVPFKELPQAEQEIVESFEDKKTYDKNIGKSYFALPEGGSSLIEWDGAK